MIINILALVLNLVQEKILRALHLRQEGNHERKYHGVDDKKPRIYKR